MGVKWGPKRTLRPKMPALALVRAHETGSSANYPVRSRNCRRYLGASSIDHRRCASNGDHLVLRTVFWYLAAAFTAMFPAGCVANGKQGAVAESICSMDFSTSTAVFLEATYITDHLHAPSLYDPDWPGRVLRPLLPPGASKGEFGELVGQRPALFGGAGLYQYRIRVLGQILLSPLGEDHPPVFAISKLYSLRTASILR